MTEIKLDKAQVAVLESAEGTVLIKDADGREVGVIDLQPYRLIKEAKRRLALNEKGFTGEQVQEHFRRLEEEWNKNGKLTKEETLFLMHKIQGETI